MELGFCCMERWSYHPVPHHEFELCGYLKIINDVFHAAPCDPLAAINFNAEVQKRYEHSPYRLDDHNQIQLPLLTQMFHAGVRSGTGKRSSGPLSMLSNPSKRSVTICLNWNFGFCEDPCSNCHKHGACSECGGSHRARDIDSCFSLLQAHRGKATHGGCSYLFFSFYSLLSIPYLLLFTLLKPLSDFHQFTSFFSFHLRPS